MSDNNVQTPTFAWVVLLIIGLYDLVRGFMHTVMVKYAAANFAMLNLTTAANDQMFLLGVFGISNYLTGVMLIIIALKARQIVTAILAVIPIVYIVGTLILTSNVKPISAFNGQYIMNVYFAVCIITAIASFVVMQVRKRRKH